VARSATKTSRVGMPRPRVAAFVKTPLIWLPRQFPGDFSWILLPPAAGAALVARRNRENFLATWFA